LKNIKFSTALTLTNQHLSFSGDIIILQIEKKILLDINLNRFKFETSLKSPSFSYSVLAESEGSLIDPTDFLLEIKWDIEMIRKFEDFIRRRLQSKMQIITRIRSLISSTIQKIGALGNKLKELTSKLRNFVCSIPGIRELCRKLRIEIIDTKKEIDKEKALLAKEQQELDKNNQNSQISYQRIIKNSLLPKFILKLD